MVPSRHVSMLDLEIAILNENKLQEQPGGKGTDLIQNNAFSVKFFTPPTDEAENCI